MTVIAILALGAMTSIASAAATGEVDQATPETTRADTSDADQENNTSNVESAAGNDESLDAGSPVSTDTNSATATDTGSGTSTDAGGTTSTDTDGTTSTSTGAGSPQRRAAGGPRASAVQAAQSPVLLGTAESFAVLGGSTVTNDGPSVISGNLGVAPGCAVTGFSPGTVVNGTIHECDAVAAQAQADLTTAYNDIAGRIPTEQVATELGGQTLMAGVYDSASGTFEITGALTLDAQGDPDAVFIFQTDSTLITASASRVVLINGAQACNVFWQVGSSATLGTGSSFTGNILALTSITANTGASVDGRLLARNGAVTLDSNTVTTSECGDGGGDGDGGGGGGGDGGGGNGDGDGGGGNGDGDGGGGNGDGDGGGGDGGGGNGDGDDGDGGLTVPIADFQGGGQTGSGTRNGHSGPSASQGSLPSTGLDILIPALIGILMLLLGAGLRRALRPARCNS